MILQIEGMDMGGGMTLDRVPACGLGNLTRSAETPKLYYVIYEQPLKRPRKVFSSDMLALKELLWKGIKP